jgi:hypothetical protein
MRTEIGAVILLLGYVSLLVSVLRRKEGFILLSCLIFLIGLVLVQNGLGACPFGPCGW